jgi:nitrate/TMAO reductase-like tetraheme cytochrome c subunit
MFKNVLTALTRNALSLIAASVAAGSAVIIVTFFALELFGFRGGPYLGILTYLILPAIMSFGLVLMPVGILRQRKRDQLATQRGEAAPRLPVIDFNRAHTRGMVLASVLIAVVSAVVLVGGTYKGVQFMDSTEFCGTACHSVMEPEYTAYQRSPHARVGCADCHIGPGAEWFVKSKLSGSWQLIAVTFDLHPRPVPSPVHSLRPARETCEQCHWTSKFVGDKLNISTHFEEDENNTELKSAVLLKVGGQQGRESSGIHWHVDPGNQIRYLSDPSRETIYDVELTQADGSVKVYRNDDAPEGSTWRTMDCVDCHNRPTHVYNSPEDEVDLAINNGEIDRSLPFIKREAVRVLQGEYDSHELAREGISTEIAAYYEQNYPDRTEELSAAIDEASEAIGNIYSWNVFPQMKVTWGTYSNHIGHQDSPGCFRCHDKRHKTEERERISKDCDTCHVLLADREEDPEILQELQP